MDNSALPRDIIFEILSYCDWATGSALTATSKECYQLRRQWRFTRPLWVVGNPPETPAESVTKLVLTGHNTVEAKFVCPNLMQCIVEYHYDGWYDCLVSVFGAELLEIKYRPTCDHDQNNFRDKDNYCHNCCYHYYCSNCGICQYCSEWSTYYVSAPAELIVNTPAEDLFMGPTVRKLVVKNSFWKIGDIEKLHELVIEVDETTNPRPYRRAEVDGPMPQLWRMTAPAKLMKRVIKKWQPPADCEIIET